VIAPGGLGVNEVAFLHRSTSTFVLTDLIQNFEPEKVTLVPRILMNAHQSSSARGAGEKAHRPLVRRYLGA
jgi:hypothetical protein